MWNKVINVDSGNKCTLECPACMRQKPDLHDLGGKPISLNIVRNLVDSGQFNRLAFCGQISDPMVHPNIVPILEYCKHKVEVEMHVAASHKPERYWRECFAANTEARYIFALDGLPSKSHLYRINQDGEKLFDMMLIAQYEYRINVTWMHIIFGYNEDEIEECKKLAKEHNIKLKLKKSGRFYDADIAGKSIYLPKNPDNFIGARLTNAKA